MQEIHFRDKPEKEAIHSGHFMVSHFEAEEQDDEDDVAVPVPETEVKNSMENIPEQIQFSIQIPNRNNPDNGITNQQLSIETSLSKLFQCMSLAYRQKLTSPKWNRFRGIRLRWKDKIRLNNVIWRCWHMQFIMKQNTLICQFASPLEVDQHNKPEAVVLEGKYWKRKLQAVTAEYKKWRMYYRNQALGCALKDINETLEDREALSWNSQSNDALNMMVDEDYMDFMSDTLFSTIGNQPFVFPDSREIAKAGLADFIQPSLGPLQPNLDDIMDTLEPLNEFINAKLPPVPEEQGADGMAFKPMGWDFSEYQVLPPPSSEISTQFPTVDSEGVKLTSYNNEIILGFPNDECIQTTQHTNIPFHTTVISKTNSSKHKTITQQHIKLTSSQAQDNIYKQPLSYPNFPISDLSSKNSSVSSEAQNVVSVANVIIPQSADRRANRRYKFTPPIQPNFKFTTQPPNNDFIMPNRTQHAQQMIPVNRPETISIQPKEMETSVIKSESGVVSRTKNIQRRPRSRSTTREPQQRPPLLSAVSDPAIINSNSSSVLLTQLLTTNNHRRASMTAALTSSSADKGSPVMVKREEQAHTVTILPTPQPPVTTLIITTPSTSTGDQILLSSMSTASSPSLDHSSRSLDSPESPSGSISLSGVGGSPGRGCDSTSPHRDRRVGHIHAEQKRRYNIKNGFDMIHSLIPHLNQNPNAKLSKAAMLQKGADYIRQLRSERNQLKEEMDTLRQQIDCLNTSISNCQSMLPATGAPVSRRRDSKMQEMFDEYVKARTIENWKFWIFSLMVKPLLVSYNNFVSTSSLEDLYRSTMLWVEQHCTLVDLRPVVLNSLRYLCTKTDILADPEKLPEEARQAVMSTTSVYP